MYRIPINNGEYEIEENEHGQLFIHYTVTNRLRRFTDNRVEIAFAKEIALLTVELEIAKKEIERLKNVPT